MNKEKGLKKHTSTIMLSTILGSASACAMQPNPQAETEKTLYQLDVMESEQDRCGLQEALAKIQDDPDYLWTLKEQSKTDRKIRVVGTNEAMTMDFRIDRLTIVVDDENKTISMRCV